jgi:hypothetical protein
MSNDNGKAPVHDAGSARSPRLRKQAARAVLDLENTGDETLLATRLCDLPVRLEGTLMARRMVRLHGELRRRSIVALPHAWLSEEFFSPDGVPGFAIPFYLAHPRLMRLERSQMLEVEGAGEAECRRILRHEAGHAIDDAYALSTRKRYRDLFGDPEAPYPDSYRPRPESRDYVINLANWYAQAHPVEDFSAEKSMTFLRGLRVTNASVVEVCADGYAADRLPMEMRRYVDRYGAHHVAAVGNYLSDLGMPQDEVHRYAGFFVGSSETMRHAIRDHVRSRRQITDADITNLNDARALIGAVQAGKSGARTCRHPCRD